MKTEKKLVMISTIIHGVRRTKFAFVEADQGGKVRVPGEKFPGVESMQRGETWSHG